MDGGGAADQDARVAGIVEQVKADLRLRPAEERGVILALSAIMLVVIIGFAALAIDIGSFYQDQRQVQGSADSAALLGADELGYLFFSPTPAGRQLLAHVPGNQLGANLTLRFGSSVARARITLAQFS